MMDRIRFALGQCYLVRARRAEIAAMRFKKKAEDFFQRMTGANK